MMTSLAAANRFRKSIWNWNHQSGWAPNIATLGQNYNKCWVCGGYIKLVRFNPSVCHIPGIVTWEQPWYPVVKWGITTYNMPPPVLVGWYSHPNIDMHTINPSHHSELNQRSKVNPMTNPMTNHHSIRVYKSTWNPLFNPVPPPTKIPKQLSTKLHKTNPSRDSNRPTLGPAKCHTIKAIIANQRIMGWTLACQIIGIQLSGVVRDWIGLSMGPLKKLQVVKGKGGYENAFSWGPHN